MVGRIGESSINNASDNAEKRKHCPANFIILLLAFPSFAEPVLVNTIIKAPRAADTRMKLNIASLEGEATLSEEASLNMMVIIPANNGKVM